MNKGIGLVLVLVLATVARVQAATWTEGVNYFLIIPPQATSVPSGKVEVTEVFSYACPFCYQFQPVMRQLRQSLPARAVIDYLPASFNPNEDWPMFQRAFLTAQTLGVAARTHEAIFDAVWKTGELAILEPGTQRLKPHMPTIEDAAAFYNQHAGVPVGKFMSTSKSFAVDIEVKAADDMVKEYAVEGTPSIIVNGKYRLDASSAGGNDQLIELVNWLVAKESP